MTARRPFLSIVLLAIALLLGGCASRPTSLDEVRQFANASAMLGGYGELSQRYRDTYAREQPYLSPAAARVARENDDKRKAHYDQFIAAQKALVLYMKTLSVLAGDGRYDLTSELDDIGAGVQALAGNGMERRQVQAWTGLTRLVTRVIASRYQGASVAAMVREGDEDVRVLLDGMMTLTRLYAKTHQGEKQTILAVFEVELPLNRKPGTRLLATMARVHYMEKIREFQLVERRYDMALEGLTKVALGHQKMREHLVDLSGTEMRQMLAAYARDLNLIRAALAVN